MTGRAYSLYIVECADGTLYTGIATDVERRLREHADSPRGAKYLKSRGPLRLVFHQAVGDRAAASRAEVRVKRLTRADKLALVAGRMALTSLVGEAQVPVDSSCT